MLETANEHHVQEQRRAAHWSELEQALQRLKHTSENKQIDSVLDQKDIPHDKKILTDREAKSQELPSMNYGASQPTEPKLLSDLHLRPRKKGDSLEKELKHIQSWIEGHNTSLSDTTRKKLGTAFNQLETCIEHQYGQKTLPRCHRPSVQSKEVPKDDLHTVLDQMISALECQSNIFASGTVRDMASQVQTLVEKLGRYNKLHDNKETLHALLDVLEQLARRGETTQQSTIESHIAPQELTAWKHVIEHNIHMYQQRLETLIHDTVIQRLDDLAQKLFELSTAKPEPSAPALSEDKLDERINQFEQHLSVLLQDIPKNQNDITQKVDHLSERMDEAQANPPQHVLLTKELESLLNTFKEKITQITLADTTKLKDILDSVLKSMLDMKSSTLASDQSIFAALRDLETQVHNIHETINGFAFPNNPQHSEEAIGRLTTAIRKIQASEQGTPDIKDSCHVHHEQDTFRAHLIETARETPFSLFSEERQPVDLDQVHFENISDPIIDRQETEQTDQDETTAASEKNIRHNLEQRLGVLRKIRKSLKLRWSA